MKLDEITTAGAIAGAPTSVGTMVKRPMDEIKDLFTRKAHRPSIDVGDAVKQVGTNRKGVILELLKGDQARVQWDMVTTEVVDQIDLSPFEQSKKFEIGERVIQQEGRGTRKMGRIWGVEGGRSFKVKWHDGNFDVVDMHHITSAK